MPSPKGGGFFIQIWLTFVDLYDKITLRTQNLLEEEAMGLKRCVMALLFIVVAVGLLGLVGCDPDLAADPGKVASGSVKDVVDYKNGVYYFDYTEAEFANALSKFIADHPELEFVGVTGNGTGGHGYDRGYFVVFRKKQLPAENPK